ncbi:hypothetical protein [Okeania sp. SIO2B3]|uniref:hypothetical protein n=1 Tax=Okeania sp. SIO2B3 TaxID=2607784 RepID=UPI0013BF21D9|nr:hypothetical protein [Okeania sp. SIO2B3]NET41438.1 hypothetical protein [Okeania sp. SIO2B3]
MVLLVSIYATLQFHIDNKLIFLQQLSNKYIKWIIVISICLTIGIIFTLVSSYYMNFQDYLVIFTSKDLKIILDKLLSGNIVGAIGLGISLGVLGSFLIPFNTEEPKIKRKPENKIE